MQKNLHKNRINFDGGNEYYYMIADFANIIGKKPNAVYQMIHRNTIRKDYLFKLHKIIYVNEKAISEHTQPVKDVQNVNIKK